MIPITAFNVILLGLRSSVKKHRYGESKQVPSARKAIKMEAGGMEGTGNRFKVLLVAVILSVAAFFSRGYVADKIADFGKEDKSSYGHYLKFYDEDDMASNDAYGVPSQKSVKAYVDSMVLQGHTTDKIVTESRKEFQNEDRSSPDTSDHNNQGDGSRDAP